MELFVETLATSPVNRALVRFFESWGVLAPEVLVHLVERVHRVFPPLTSPEAALAIAEALVRTWWEDMQLGIPFGEGARAAFLLGEVGRRWPSALLSSQVSSELRETLHASQLIPMPATHPAPMPDQHLAPEGWLLRLLRSVRPEPTDAGATSELPW
jgi:hypothetical protein